MTETAEIVHKESKGTELYTKYEKLQLKINISDIDKFEKV